MIVEWLNNNFTRAIVTCRAPDYRWWRRRYVRAEIKSVAREERTWHDYNSLVFVANDVRVCDSDDQLAQDIWENRSNAIAMRNYRLHRDALAAKGNPWVAVEPLPRARVVGKS